METSVFLLLYLYSIFATKKYMFSFLLCPDVAILLYLELSEVLLEVASMCTYIQNGCIGLHDLGILCKDVKCIIHIVLRECLILHCSCDHIRVCVAFA